MEISKPSSDIAVSSVPEDINDKNSIGVKKLDTYCRSSSVVDVDDGRKDGFSFGDVKKSSSHYADRNIIGNNNQDACRVNVDTACLPKKGKIVSEKNSSDYLNNNENIVDKTKKFNNTFTNLNENYIDDDLFEIKKLVKMQTFVNLNSIKSLEKIERGESSNNRCKRSVSLRSTPKLCELKTKNYHEKYVSSVRVEKNSISPDELLARSKYPLLSPNLDVIGDLSSLDLAGNYQINDIPVFPVTSCKLKSHDCEKKLSILEPPPAGLVSRQESNENWSKFLDHLNLIMENRTGEFV